MAENTWDGFEWRGKRLKMYGEILDGASSCTHPEEAAAFKVAYANALGDMSVASGNLGYLFGYLDREARDRLYALFMDVAHPVFGTHY